MPRVHECLRSVDVFTPQGHDVAAVKLLYGLSADEPADPFCTDEDTPFDPDCTRFDMGADPLNEFYVTGQELPPSFAIGSRVNAWSGFVNRRLFLDPAPARLSASPKRLRRVQTSARP